MKLGMMLEVNETFMTIWLSRSSEVRIKVRRWCQSLSGLFSGTKDLGKFLMGHFQWEHQMQVV